MTTYQWVAVLVEEVLLAVGPFVLNPLATDDEPVRGARSDRLVGNSRQSLLARPGAARGSRAREPCGDGGSASERVPRATGFRARTTAWRARRAGGSAHGTHVSGIALAMSGRPVCSRPTDREVGAPFDAAEADRSDVGTIEVAVAANDDAVEAFLKSHSWRDSTVIKSTLAAESAEREAATGADCARPPATPPFRRA